MCTSIQKYDTHSRIVDKVASTFGANNSYDSITNDSIFLMLISEHFIYITYMWCRHLDIANVDG